MMKKTAKAFIAERQLSMKDSARAQNTAALLEARQDAKPSVTDAVEDEAMSLVAKVATLTVSDEKKKLSLYQKSRAMHTSPRTIGTKVKNCTRQPLKLIQPIILSILIALHVL
jgi:hypothetical protein